MNNGRGTTLNFSNAKIAVNSNDKGMACIVQPGIINTLYLLVGSLWISTLEYPFLKYNFNN